MRRYIAKLTFEVGEAGVPFIHGVEAQDMDSAQRKIQWYMHEWYGEKPDEETENQWVWYNLGVRVKLSMLSEVKNFVSLWQETMPIR